ncbi:kinase-like domain-containing protein [Nemania abortiva]|nr:kinase-like domain-containing protein [Nemania abortiva]
MEDLSDVMLYLFPHQSTSPLGIDEAKLTIDSTLNQQRVLEVRLQDKSRKQLLLPNQRPHFGISKGLVLRFSDGARTHHGVVCGSDPNADLHFVSSDGIVSKYHLAFTFDDQNRPIARDLGSRGGTKVVYDGEQRHRCSDFDWPLLGPGITKGEPPILSIAEGVEFTVVVPPHDLTSQDYIEKVKQFRSGTADADQLFASLAVESGQSTRCPTGQQSPLSGPGSGPLTFERNIGRGGFGAVTYVCNLRTGEEYVVKKPLDMKSQEYDEEDWVREADIMGELDHPHIVKLRNALFTPHPVLELEYVPEGSLDHHVGFSTFESTQILVQLSSALKYLHGRSTGHRDIKPQNILVKRRGEDGIHVQFADFGLAKTGTMRTFCGTLQWAAPEIHYKAVDISARGDVEYSLAVDIWSLGMVVASLECGFPERNATTRRAREHFVKKLEDQNNPLLRLVIDHMLLEDPDMRSSANECYDKAKELLDAMTPNPNDHNAAPIASVSAQVSQSALTEEIQNQETSEISRRIVETITLSLISELGRRDESLIDSIVNDSIADPTESEDSSRSGPITPDSQASQVSEATLRPWDPEISKPASERTIRVAGGGSNVEPEVQTNDQQNGLPLLPPWYPSEELLGDGARGSQQSTRKRNLTADTPPLRSLAGLLSYLEQSGAEPDVSIREGQPDHKRSKMGE